MLCVLPSTCKLNKYEKICVFINKYFRLPFVFQKESCSHSLNCRCSLTPFLVSSGVEFLMLCSRECELMNEWVSYTGAFYMHEIVGISSRVSPRVHLIYKHLSGHNRPALQNNNTNDYKSSTVGTVCSDWLLVSSRTINVDCIVLSPSMAREKRETTKLWLAEMFSPDLPSLLLTILYIQTSEQKLNDNLELDFLGFILKKEHTFVIRIPFNF